MTSRNWLTRGVLAALAVTTVACSSDQTGPLSPDAAALNLLPSGEYVRVYKFGPAGVYPFTAEATGGDLSQPAFDVTAGSYRVIWTSHDELGGPYDVTVTETLLPGMQVDSIILVRTTPSGPIAVTKVTGTNTATAEDLDFYTGTYFKFYNSYTPPNGGGEGCTPGFWKQTQHFPFWTAPYTPGTLFSAVFEDAFPGMTLLQVASLGGGGLNALGRHTVAALLNAASADVDYGFTVQEVIDGFNAVFPGGDYEGLKGDFEYENELGCGLGMSMLQ